MKIFRFRPSFQAEKEFFTSSRQDHVRKVCLVFSMQDKMRREDFTLNEFCFLT
jgi:hypothetical protein